jgi:hypothetical protein
MSRCWSWRVEAEVMVEIIMAEAEAEVVLAVY